MISKEKFCNAINTLKAMDDFIMEINALFHKYKCDGYIYPEDGTCIIASLLKDMFNDEDDWIGYYCFELNYGKLYKPDMIKNDDGSDIKLSTPEELYDFLVENIKVNNKK